jgi:hypothetical protein
MLCLGVCYAVNAYLFAAITPSLVYTTILARKLADTKNGFKIRNEGFVGGAWPTDGFLILTAVTHG